MADVWCAAFVWKKVSDPSRPYPITHDVLRRIAADDRGLPEWLRTEVRRLSREYQFFHWPIAFPNVFRVSSGGDEGLDESGLRGGFDLVLGNPPWETLSPDQREFFGGYVDGLRSMAPDEQGAVIQWARRSARDWRVLVCSLSKALRTSPPPEEQRCLHAVCARQSWQGGLQHVSALRGARVAPHPAGRLRCDDRARRVVRGCERYRDPEAPVRLLRTHTALRFDKHYSRLVCGCRYGPVCRLHPARRGGRTGSTTLRFGLANPADLERAPLQVAADVIRRLSPDTYAIPDLRALRADYQPEDVRRLSCVRRPNGWPSVPPLPGGNPHGQRPGPVHERSEGLPVYEGRIIHHFDHRAKTYRSGHGNNAVWVEREFGDPEKVIVPQWRVPRASIPSRLRDRCGRFRIGFCDVANPRNQRSLAAALLPPGVICGQRCPPFTFPSDFEWAYLAWLAVANSLVMDWLARAPAELTDDELYFSSTAFHFLGAPLPIRLYRA